MTVERLGKKAADALVQLVEAVDASDLADSLANLATDGGSEDREDDTESSREQLGDLVDSVLALVADARKRRLIDFTLSGGRTVSAEPADGSRDAAIRALARERRHVDGDVEFDGDAVVSEGDDNGAYVQAWVWVSFEGTPLDSGAAE